jgi:hypothetical protein
MLQKRTHQKHGSYDRMIKRGQSGKLRSLTSSKSDLVRLRVGKSSKQVRPNQKTKLRKEWM